jgi:UDP-glucose 4-epimerase
MSEFKTLLVPGGLGFIGSHTLIDILENTNLKTVIIDDMSNCFPDILPRIKLILSEKLSAEQI